MTSTINIRLASNRVNNSLMTGDRIPRLFTPGEVITKQQNFMRFILIACDVELNDNYDYLEVMERTVMTMT